MNSSATKNNSGDFLKSAAKKINPFFFDIFIFIISYFLAFFVRFEGLPEGIHLKRLLMLFPYIALARIISFFVFSVYSIAWKYVSIADAVSIFKACVPVTAILFLARLVLPDKLALLRIPYSVVALEFLLTLTGTLGIRLARRLNFELAERERLENKGDKTKKTRTLLIGAGDAGNMVIKELKQRADLNFEIVGFIDDDQAKLNSVIQGVKVLGNSAEIPEIVSRLNVEEAIITIANASSKEIRRIAGICEGTNIRVKIVPGLFEMLDEKIKITKIRKINIDDLLGRSIVSFENHLPDVQKHYQNKRILVTGAGGSIGSELCRQLEALLPRDLILLDKDENSIFEIESELKGRFGGQGYGKIHPLIANLKNQEQLAQIFEKYRPEVVFHAAAHKHVPLMESNIAEAILNNVIGTKNLVELADQRKVERLIFISTDKAVNPTSVMGATKKIGEIIVQEMAAKSQTRFSCVRFGNVLGSRGSVVPFFQKQIDKGGPLTITHPEMERYFMSISEAVQLIIQAGTLGNKGEIFVLDMGKPIKIRELAKELIRLSGHREDEIDIQYVGLRPGEKLYEEILVDEEKTKATQFKKVYIAPPIELNNGEFNEKLAAIVSAAKSNNEKKIIRHLSELGIGYLGDKIDISK